MRGLLVALEHEVGKTQKAERTDDRLKRIEADVGVKDLDRFRRLTGVDQDHRESIVDEIGIERKGPLESRDGGVVLAFVKPHHTKLSVRLGQAGIEVNGGLGQ